MYKTTRTKKYNKRSRQLATLNDNNEKQNFLPSAGIQMANYAQVNWK